MAHGAPPPQDIIFKVRVLPATTETEAALAPGNQPDPAKPIKGPYRRYVIDYAALSNAFQLTLQPNGNRTGSVEFSTFLYDSNGKLLNATGETINLNLDPATYKRVANGIGAHLEISAPAKATTTSALASTTSRPTALAPSKSPSGLSVSCLRLPSLPCHLHPPRHQSKLGAANGSATALPGAPGPVTHALFNPRLKSLARANVLVLGSVALALLLSGAPQLRPDLWILVPTAFVMLGTADTIRNIRPRWSMYHAGVLLCIYMDLMAVALVLFLLLYPYLNLGVRGA